MCGDSWGCKSRTQLSELNRKYKLEISVEIKEHTVLKKDKNVST